MRVLAVGAGIIGSLYGWALTEGRHQVAHLVRSGTAAALRDDVSFDMFDRRKGTSGTSVGCTNWMLAADRCTPEKQTRRAYRRSIVCFQYDHRRLLGNSLALKVPIFCGEKG